MKILRLPHFWCIFSIILTQHLSLADDKYEALDKNDDVDEEFGIEANEEEERDFKSKAHFDPGTYFFVLNQDHGKSNAQYQSILSNGPIMGQIQKNTRPTWNNRK